MKRFKFNLNTPLRVKQKIEQIKKQQLMQAIITLEREKYELKILEESKAAVKVNLEQKMRESLKAAELPFFEACINTLDLKVKKQKYKVAGAHERYNKAVDDFISSKQEREILEKLKDKRFGAYLIESNREEQKILDDIASLAYFRRGGGFKL
ncbi:flagellar export protein FliJ [Thermosediminibacter oceani]|uniref:Flagellar FliJ protein n=1 Tax=Thermosediminibacter oceani (strain ATCC BAA-1034 / DSM 16646 / JW/IW-1228P) TaxID=555079 RepID=D9S383_THEOJ|nr:flagellar export protein FliJ [Thermosediminibacter oceani]ADL07860.1 flagellar export protein FliJ [Thermosediminibacter oceani DSM 16646]